MLSPWFTSIYCSSNCTAIVHCNTHKIHTIYVNNHNKTQLNTTAEYLTNTTKHNETNKKLDEASYRLKSKH